MKESKTNWWVIVAVAVVVAVISSLITISLTGNVIGVAKGTYGKVYTTSEIDSKLLALNQLYISPLQNRVNGLNWTLNNNISTKEIRADKSTFKEYSAVIEPDPFSGTTRFAIIISRYDASFISGWVGGLYNSLEEIEVAFDKNLILNAEITFSGDEGIGTIKFPSEELVYAFTGEGIYQKSPSGVMWKCLPKDTGAYACSKYTQGGGAAASTTSGEGFISRIERIASSKI